MAPPSHDLGEKYLRNFQDPQTCFLVLRSSGDFWQFWAFLFLGL